MPIQPSVLIRFVGILATVLLLVIGNNAKAQEADSIVVIGAVKLSGHEKTKDYIVLRELDFKSGDTLRASELAAMKVKGIRQIFDLELFNTVEMQIAPPDSLGLTHITIYLKERWYLFVLPIVEIADRNFNQWWLADNKLSRINYGIRIRRSNLRGRNETIRINIQSGYTRKFSVDYNFPYINKALTIGAALNFTYSDNRELWYATKNNKLQFFHDTGKISFRRLKTGVTFSLRKKIYSSQLLDLEYTHLQVADTVAKTAVNPDYFLDGRTRQQTFYAGYRYIYEMLDYKHYPLNGKYLSAEAGNYFFINAPYNLFNAFINASYHKRLNGRHYASLSVDAKYSSPGRQPYNLYKAFGYGYYVRGFEYYVIDGQHFALGKINYLYNLLKPKFIHIPTGGIKKFRNIPITIFAKAFYDAGYVADNNPMPTNTFANSYLGGVGAGIDIVTYYDRVFKIEYTFNNKGQKGLFFHYNMLF